MNKRKPIAAVPGGIPESDLKKFPLTSLEKLQCLLDSQSPKAVERKKLDKLSYRLDVEDTYIDDNLTLLDIPSLQVEFVFDASGELLGAFRY